CRTGLAPSVARVSPRPAAPEIQEALALRVEVKETKHAAARRSIQRMLAADELVVGHSAVGQYDGPPCLHEEPRSVREARTEHDRIQEVPFEPEMRRHRAVVERTR